METIDPNDPGAERVNLPEVIDEDDLRRDLQSLTAVQQGETPVERMQSLAEKLERYINQRIDLDLGNNKQITSSTREWIRLQIELLDKIHKNTVGEKKTTLKLELTHKHLAALMRDGVQTRQKTLPADFKIENPVKWKKDGK